MVARIPDEESFGRMKRDQSSNSRRLDDLERTDGSQYARALEKIKALVAGLDAQVQAAITLYSYTRSQIESLVWLYLLPPSKGGTGTANAATNTFTSGGPWNMLYAKTATGEIGHAPSNREFKQDIHDAFTPDSIQLSIVEPDPAGLLQFPVQAFRYRDDVAERGDEAIQQYGFIAEDLAAAGFDPWLQFDHDGGVVGIAYDKLPLAHHEILRRLWRERYEHRWRIGELEAAVASQQSLIDELLQRVAAVEGGRDGSV